MSSKSKKIIGLSGVVLAISLAFSVGLQYLIYPTAEHRTAEHQYRQAAMANDSDAMTLIEQKDVFQWTQSVAPVQFLLLVLVNVGLTYGTYAYIRRHGLGGNRIVGLVAIIITVTSTMAALLSALIHTALTSGDWVQPSSFLMLLGVLETLLISFFVAAIAEKIYKKRNNFSIK